MKFRAFRLEVPALNLPKTLALFAGIAVYGWAASAILGQQVTNTQGRIDRVNERIDATVHDVGEVNKDLARHVGTSGHPDIVKRVDKLEAAVVVIQTDLSGLRGEIRGGGLLATILLVGLQIMNLMGVKISSRNLTPPDQGS